MKASGVSARCPRQSPPAQHRGHVTLPPARHPWWNERWKETAREKGGRGRLLRLQRGRKMKRETERKCVREEESESEREEKATFAYGRMRMRER